MTDPTQTQTPRRRASIAEVVLIAALAFVVVVGVPSYLKSIESNKAAEAFDFLAHVYDQQNQFHRHHDRYADSLETLDLGRTAPTHFSIGDIIADSRGWSLSLTRVGSHFGYGDYRITFDENGFDRFQSNIDRQVRAGSSSNHFPLGQR